jgi:hypothetical protein
MEINDQAPAIGMAEAIVAAPVDTVWEVLRDLPNWPSWNRSVSKLEQQGDIRPGTSFVWVAGGSTIRSRIEEIERPRRIVWTGRTLGIRAVHVWEFEATPDGTRVRTRESFEGLIVRCFRRPMKKMLDRALQQGVEALKAEAEARHGRPTTVSHHPKFENTGK